MSELTTKLPTDTWIAATWEEYLKTLEDPAYEKAQGYYHNRQMRIEMTPLGHDHACDHTIITLAISLFCGVKGILAKGLTNCTYRKTGYQDAQKEYWILDVKRIEITAFAIAEGGSRRITDSQVLPGLAISLLNEALQRTRQMNQSQVVSWLLSSRTEINAINCKVGARLNHL